MEVQIGNARLELIRGDITEMDTEAIVNAANSRLAHGGGVAGAIVRKGGHVIQAESDAWVREHGPVPTGGAAITGAGRLKARYVIHAVGPVYDGTPRCAELLASAVRSSLALADERGIKSIALPAISTGIFGYPMDEAAGIILRTVVDYLRGETGLERVVLCLWDERAYRAFERALGEIDAPFDSFTRNRPDSR